MTVLEWLIAGGLGVMIFGLSAIGRGIDEQNSNLSNIAARLRDIDETLKGRR